MVWDSKKLPSMGGKTVIVTGGNSGIGYGTARKCAELGAKVIIASRTKGSSERAVSRIRDSVSGAEVSYVPLDLSDLGSVRAAAEAILGEVKQIDALVNNAGVMMTPQMQTKDGFEYQLGVNHFGHFLLTSLLAQRIMDTPDSRVVNVSSIGHKRGTIDFDNLMYENGGYTPFDAYRRSKLANILFHYGLQRYLAERGSGTLAVASHPGLARTNLGRYLLQSWRGKLLFTVLFLPSVFVSQSAAGGAQPSLRALTDADAVSGDYFGPSQFNEYRGKPVKVDTTEYSKQPELASKLWDVSNELTGANWP